MLQFYALLLGDNGVRVNVLMACCYSALLFPPKIRVKRVFAWKNF
jgi:hypothetical protein